MNRIDALSKNYLINGAMDFAQRIGTGSAVVDGLKYYLDRWVCNRGGNWSADPDISRVDVNIPTQPKISHAMQITDGNDVDGTAKLIVRQRVESIFARELANEKASLGFLYNQNQFQQITIRFYTPDVKDDFSGAVTQFGSTIVRTITNDSTWRELLVEDILMSADTNRGLLVALEIENAENTGVNITSLLTGFKLSLGEKAQEFSFAGRDYLQELQYCQRYYINWPGKKPFVFYSASATSYRPFIQVFPQLMRVSPSVDIDFDILGNIASIVAENKNTNGFVYQINTSGTGNATCNIGSYTADAEL